MSGLKYDDYGNPIFTATKLSGCLWVTGLFLAQMLFWLMLFRWIGRLD